MGTLSFSEILAQRAELQDVIKGIRAAQRAYAQANEWPRCGQGWGERPSEKKHLALLAKIEANPWLNAKVREFLKGD